MYDWWIFDLDGTLTVPVHDFAALRQELGLTPGQDILAGIAGHPAKLRRVREWEEELALQAVAQPDALALMATIDRPCAILTRNLKHIALSTLQTIGLAHRFDPDVVLGREDAAAKPSPDGVLRILEHWGADPARTVMIGDWVYDVQAGHRAGCRTVWVRRDDRGDWSSEADITVDRLDELIG